MTALVVLATTYSFAGGDLGELARSLSAWSHQPTVALIQSIRSPERRRRESGALTSDPTPLVKPFALGYPPALGDGKDLARLMRVKAKVGVQANSDSIALWSPSWEVNTLVDDMYHCPLPDGWAMAYEKAWTVKGGKATFALKPKFAMRVGDLAELGWSKPVKTHWLIEKMWVVPVAKAADEKSVLRAIATSTSGKLIKTKEAYRIDLDPAAFRLRVQVCIAKESPKAEPGTRLAYGYDVNRAAWDWISDDTIRALYAEPFAKQLVDVPIGTPLHTAVSRFLDFTRKSEATDSSYQSLFALIDWNRPPRIWLGQGTGTAPAWRRKGGGTVIL